MVRFGEIGTDLGGAGVVQWRVEDTDAAVLQGFSEPCVQFARGFVEVVALSHGDGDMGLADEGLPFFPCVQLHQAVAAHQPPQLRARKLLAEDLDGWLTGFDDVEDSVRHTVKLIRKHPLMPDNIAVHGLVIHPTTGKLNLIVDGSLPASDGQNI